MHRKRAESRRRGGKGRSAESNSLPTLKQTERLVIGRRAVEESIRHAPERVARFFLVNGRSPEIDFPRGVPTEYLSSDDLSALARSESHQGVAAVVTVQPLSLKDLLPVLESKPRALIVALDSVTDPHNVGSVMRAAECFGADALIWSHNRGPGVTAVVSKSSAGASELLPSVTIANLAHALRDLKAAGYWIVAADVGSDAVDLPNFQFPDKSVLVLGSEGGGLRSLTRSLCDYVVKIPMSGRIASLNVSQASAVILAAWASGRTA